MRSRFFAGRAASLLLASTLVAAGAFLWRPTGQSATAINVVVITLDTTRADHLSAYGLMDVTMPALDRLAREGVVFDQATSVAPLTLPAHTSLFTGLFPPTHKVRDNADRPLDAGFNTLAELLKTRSFRTGAFVGSIVLGPERGLAQGFDRYSTGSTSASARLAGDRARQRRADAVVTDAIGWLEEVKDTRFLLWAHLYDPHRPYEPPEPFRSKHSDPYVAEILYADSQIARLLAALEERQLLERTIVIVAGDHGESRGDHGEQDHGVFIYESVLRVPLIVRAPSISPGRVGSVVRLTDVMPTVLDLLGIPVPTMDGVSLRELLTGRRQDLGLEAYAESEYPRRLGCAALHALREGRFKLIDGPRPELYDLERDPFEDRNLYDERRATAAAMTQRLRELVPRASTRGPRLVATPAVLPPDLSRQLHALGYIGAPTRQKSAASGGFQDPAACNRLLQSSSGVSGASELLRSR
jgi:arylsulfatase A-like enzyme